MKKYFMLWILFVVVLSTKTVFSDIYTFSDNTFNTSDWTATLIQYGNGGSATASQMTTGGNPNSYRRYTHTVNTPSSSSMSEISIYHLRNSAIYTPSIQGAITSIDYLEDTFGNIQIGGGLALMQNDILYFGAYRIDVNSSWMRHTYYNLTASDFYLASFFYSATLPDIHPDFSSSGLPITFGFMRANSQDAGYPFGYTGTGGTDNWEVRFTVVPEPFTFSMFIIGGWFLLKRIRA